MVVEEYERRVKEIEEKLPWKKIALHLMFGEMGDPNVDPIAAIILEYKTLKLELEGMREFPENWKGKESHVETHFRALEWLLGGVNGN